MKFFGPHERLWLIGPIALLMFWLYSVAVQVKGPWKIVIGVPFIVINFLFNSIFGSFIFWELPQWHKKEFLFTDRLKRHKRDPKNPESLRVANIICTEMNKADPDHC